MEWVNFKLADGSQLELGDDGASLRCSASLAVRGDGVLPYLETVKFVPEALDAIGEVELF